MKAKAQRRKEKEAREALLPPEQREALRKAREERKAAKAAQDAAQ